jgi:hypothetical protein
MSVKRILQQNSPNKGSPNRPGWEAPELLVAEVVQAKQAGDSAWGRCRASLTASILQGEVHRVPPWLSMRGRWLAGLTEDIGLACLVTGHGSYYGCATVRSHAPPRGTHQPKQCRPAVAHRTPRSPDRGRGAAEGGGTPRPGDRRDTQDWVVRVPPVFCSAVQEAGDRGFTPASAAGCAVQELR